MFYSHLVSKGDTSQCTNILEKSNFKDALKHNRLHILSSSNKWDENWQRQNRSWMVYKGERHIFVDRIVHYKAREPSISLFYHLMMTSKFIQSISRWISVKWWCVSFHTNNWPISTSGGSAQTSEGSR